MQSQNSFVVKRIILKGEGNRGERLPMLLDRATRAPLPLQMTWSLSSRRALPVAANTMERELRYLAHLEVWLRQNKMSLSDPLSFVERFTPSRIENSLRPWLGKDTSARKVKKISVSSAEIKNRILVIAAFIDWVLGNAERSLSFRTEAAQCIAFSNARRDISRTFTQIIPTQSSESDIEGLSSADANKLLVAIHPDNAMNVWARGDGFHAKQIRHRNYLVVLILLAYGLRRGDLLKLCTGDVKTHGSNPTLWIRRRPDDPYDPRVWEPNAKTQERVLPLDSMLTRALNDYVSDCRKHIPNQKKTPYLILSITNGQPMATRTLNDIFKPLTALFPGIHPHKLRHTHNDRLRAHCREKGIGDKEMRDHAKYLNGWFGDNMGRYTKREARESARNISSQVQAQLFAPILDVPF